MMKACGLCANYRPRDGFYPTREDFNGSHPKYGWGDCPYARFPVATFYGSECNYFHEPSAHEKAERLAREMQALR